MIGEVAKWILIIIVGFFGYTIIYIIGWQIFASIAPDTVEKYNLHFVIKDVKKHFGFLFDKGYTISKTSYSYQNFGNWIITLESQKCTIKLVQDRLELLLSLAPRNAEIKDSFSLEAMIYFVTKGQIIVGSFDGDLSWGKKKQYERLSNLLKEYHDQLIPYLDNDNYLENDFGNYKYDLVLMQRKYNDLLMEDYRQKHMRR
jgi:hypothetical protein